MKKNFSVNRYGLTTITVKNLFANVVVERGQVGSVSVVLSGDPKLIGQIGVTQPATNKILIEEDRVGGVITIIQSNGRQAIFLRNVAGSTVVSQSETDGRFTVFSGKELVIDNGAVVSGENVTFIEAAKIPLVTITVPPSTCLDIEDVLNLLVSDVEGPLNLTLHGQTNAVIDGVDGGTIQVSGRSKAILSKAVGNFALFARWQSQINLSGNLGNIYAVAENKSSIVIGGQCQDCSGEASGLSHVTVQKATGKVTKASSGMSYVTIETD